MENAEKLTWQIWNQENMGKTLLIGGILYYIPVLNLLLLGYYGLWIRQLVAFKGMDLPAWKDGRALLEELGRVIVPFLIWVAVPVILAGLMVYGLTGILFFMHLGFFARTVAWLPIAVIALLSPPAITVAMIRVYKTGHIRESLAVAEIFQLTIRHLRSALFPIFQYYGILAIGWPLLGFAAFLGTLPLLAQLILVYRDADEDLKSAKN